jgi:hypothetical protein
MEVRKIRYLKPEEIYMIYIIIPVVFIITFFLFPLKEFIKFR